MTETQVFIVGAGPGDPELLTRKALRLLSEADMIIYDRLISPEIIALIPEHTETLYAGKSCKKHIMTQDEINIALVEHAKLGKKIVRLKGGDPLTFGRGGEEFAALSEAGINFEITPGITAAHGCSSYHGIPLTHRGVANGVHFITGHKQKGQDMQYNWGYLADPQTTLVIYMGLANLALITEQLIKHGLSKNTPVAAIHRATTPDAKICISDLENITAEIIQNEITPPTIIIIGEVVNMRIKSNL